MEESVLDFDRCECGGKLRFASSVEEAEEIFTTQYFKQKKNYLSLILAKFSFINKKRALLATFLILTALILLIPGFIYSDADHVQPDLMQPQPLKNTDGNISEIEIIVISNGPWKGFYDIYKLEQSLTTTTQYRDDHQRIEGTGNKNFKLTGVFSQILFQFGKQKNDGEKLTVKLVINNTIVETHTIDDSTDTIIIDYFFFKDNGDGD